MDGENVNGKAAAEREIARLERESDSIYEEVRVLHTQAWEEHSWLDRITRHRGNLEFLADHPLRARFAGNLHERISRFEKYMAEKGEGGDWGGVDCLDRLRQLEATTTENAKRLRSLLIAAEAHWEAVNNKLSDARCKG
jgi:hypothetical protein